MEPQVMLRDLKIFSIPKNLALVLVMRFKKKINWLRK